MEKRRDIIEGIGRVWLCMRRYGRRKISEIDIGLTFDQMLVLFTIHNHEGVKIGDIADLTDRDRTTTSRMISGLEKKSLVIRVPDRNDNRQKMIYLTRSAKELLDGLDPARKDFEREIFKGIKKADIDKAAEILNKVADNLEK